MSALREFNGPKEGAPVDSEKIGFDTLSKLTGFPVEFIKKELFLSEDNISMGNLRLKVLDYIKRSNSVNQD